MKNLFLLAALVSLFVCGCNKPDPKVAQLEQRISMLESNLARVEADYNQASNTITSILDIQMDTMKIISPLTNLAALDLQTTIDPATGLPVGNSSGRPAGTGSALDPATGLPTDEAPKVLRVANRVTEANESWWRWALTVFIANPSPLPTKVDARVKFLDKDGFIIATKDMFGLALGGASTNQFSDYTLVDLPGARRVASITADLEE